MMIATCRGNRSQAIAASNASSRDPCCTTATTSESIRDETFDHDHDACQSVYFTESNVRPQGGAVAALAGRTPGCIAWSISDGSSSQRPADIKVPAIDRTM